MSGTGTRTRAVTNKTSKVLISIPESDLAFIKDMVTKTNEKVNEIEKTLGLLNQTVVGNQAYGHKGLVLQVQENTDYIEKDKSYKAKVVGGATVIAIVYGFVLKFWEKIF